MGLSVLVLGVLVPVEKERRLLMPGTTQPGAVVGVTAQDMVMGINT